MPKTYQQGCIDVVALDDRLTCDEVDAVGAAFTQLLVGGLPQVIVDMRRVRLIDSAGLECLHDAHESCRRRGGELRLASASKLVRDVLRITGVDEEIGVSDDVVVAAGEFAQ